MCLIFGMIRLLRQIVCAGSLCFENRFFPTYHVSQPGATATDDAILPAPELHNEIPHAVRGASRPSRGRCPRRPTTPTSSVERCRTRAPRYHPLPIPVPHFVAPKVSTRAIVGTNSDDRRSRRGFPASSFQ